MAGPEPDQALLEEAVALESMAHRMLLDGEAERARGRLREAADAYRRSWEAAPPTAYGRLVGMLKAALLAGGGNAEAAYVRALDLPTESPVACYALGVAALVAVDDDTARTMAQRLRTADDAFRRAGDGIAAVADRDPQRVADAVAAIEADFAARDRHLTGVPIADTGLMVLRLAGTRGVEVTVDSPLLPTLP